MKRIITTAVLGCFLLGAGVADAKPVTKLVFENVTAIPEAGPLTIRAGTKEVKKANYTVCEYYRYPTDEYLGAYESALFTSTDADAVLGFCLSHYDDRK